ncbi:unnamed protein product, partial [marine sediment metagenome]
MLDLASKLPMSGFASVKVMTSDLLREKLPREAIQTCLEAIDLSNPDYMPKLVEYPELCD